MKLVEIILLYFDITGEAKGTVVYFNKNMYANVKLFSPQDTKSYTKVPIVFDYGYIT